MPDDATGLPQSVEEWLQFVQRKLSVVKKGRQTGADWIPSEFYIAAGEAAQVSLAELLHKAKCSGPPMSWRCGPTWAAPRKPLMPLSPHSSRALLRADHKAKLFSSAIRDALAPALKQLVGGNQSGAVRGGGTEFPMFIARLFLLHAADRKRSAGLLFGDMQKAYYLELILGPLLIPGEREVVFKGLGMEGLRSYRHNVVLKRGIAHLAHCLCRVTLCKWSVNGSHWHGLQSKALSTRLCTT